MFMQKITSQFIYLALIFCCCTKELMQLSDRDHLFAKQLDAIDTILVLGLGSADVVRISFWTWLGTL